VTIYLPVTITAFSSGTLAAHMMANAGELVDSGLIAMMMQDLVKSRVGLCIGVGTSDGMDALVQFDLLYLVFIWL
jgi:hypothetical protein